MMVVVASAARGITLAGYAGRAQSRACGRGAAPLRPSALVHHHACLGGTGVQTGAAGGARRLITLGGGQRFVCATNHGG
jgi:hypothetical protein